jgi:hypothetical protein
VWRRRAVAYLDTVDWDLDIWVQPDRTWTWKDEDLFVERLAHADAYWVDDGTSEAEVRPGGLRPDPAWPAIPTELPDGWQTRPHVRRHPPRELSADPAR